MKQVRIDTSGIDLFLDLKEIKEYQGDLASISGENIEKLKRSIMAKGFFVPFFVWNCDGTWHIIDGHQRKKALLSLISDGVSVPSKFPCIAIVAGSHEDAKEKLLVVTSQYKEFNPDAVESWINDLGDSISSLVRLVDRELVLNLDLALPSFDEETDEDEPKGKKSCVCPECGCEF